MSKLGEPRRLFTFEETADLGEHLGGAVDILDAVYSETATVPESSDEAIGIAAVLEQVAARLRKAVS